VEVVVEQHNPGWAGKFDRESQLVARALDPTVVAIHHIGSTAIPTIYAKPIIDMLVEVTSIDEVDSRNVAMASLGYEAMGEYGIAGRRYFTKDSDAGIREYQVHAFVAGSAEIDRHIAFRDFMQAHPELARRYSDLKRRLANEHRRDIDQYVTGKDGFIKEMERKALAWRRSAQHH
jgi:GrpB-like predicted nucleotidyltransferase (UPF0157 family)